MLRANSTPVTRAHLLQIVVGVKCVGCVLLVIRWDLPQGIILPAVYGRLVLASARIVEICSNAMTALPTVIAVGVTVTAPAPTNMSAIQRLQHLVRACLVGL